MIFPLELLFQKQKKTKQIVFGFLFIFECNFPFQPSQMPLVDPAQIHPLRPFQEFNPSQVRHLPSHSPKHLHSLRAKRTKRNVPSSWPLSTRLVTLYSAHLTPTRITGSRSSLTLVKKMNRLISPKVW